MSHTETFGRTETGYYHNKANVPSLAAHGGGWLIRVCGQDHPTLMKAIVRLLDSYGPPVEIEFKPTVAAGVKTVRVEVRSGGKVLHHGSVYQETDSPGWFGMSIHVLCSVWSKP